MEKTSAVESSRPAKHDKPRRTTIELTDTDLLPVNRHMPPPLGPEQLIRRTHKLG
jgi:hypothetical protein